MVDEFFLQQAVNIRRSYLKLSNNMEFYAKRASNVVKGLDDIIDRINKLQEQASNDRVMTEQLQAEKATEELNKIFEDLEMEANKLEGLMDPINKDIEKLAIEEQELYRQIKEKNTHLTDDQIIESVRKRLEEEKLL